jgi:NAD(P)-dependent dehydrogenase (short-subunit alcohol dehydrogenase family)
VAIHFAREGADVGIIYLNEDRDAEKTQSLVEQEGKKCRLFRGDVSDISFCEATVNTFVKEFGQVDILINNAAQQYPTDQLGDIDPKRLNRTFEVNIYAQFHLTTASLKHMPEGGRIINTTSVTAFRGSKHLMDYASTKGAIVSFTRSLSQNLADKKILVNAVAPGPIWTPLIPATFGEDKVESFGKNVLLERAGQPAEVAPAYVFLASQDGSYVTGQTLHINGGEIVGG